MTSKNLYFLVCLFIFVLILLVATLQYHLVQKDKQYSQFVADNFINIRGVIVRISDFDSDSALREYDENGIDFKPKLMVVDYNSSIEPQFYLLHDLSGIHEEELQQLKSTDVAGKCISLYAMPDRSRVADPPTYVDSLQLIYINKYEITEDLDCYHNKNSDTLVNYSDSYNEIDLSAVVEGMTRPAFDIAYDYQVTLPKEQADVLGYYDSSGIENKEGGVVQIPIVTINNSILKELETAKRAQRQVSIRGNFESGYAESMVFKIYNMEVLEQ